MISNISKLVMTKDEIIAKDHIEYISRLPPNSTADLRMGVIYSQFLGDIYVLNGYKENFNSQILDVQRKIEFFDMDCIYSSFTDNLYTEVRSVNFHSQFMNILFNYLLEILQIHWFLLSFNNASNRVNDFNLCDAAVLVSLNVKDHIDDIKNNMSVAKSSSQEENDHLILSIIEKRKNAQSRYNEWIGEEKSKVNLVPKMW